MSQNNSDLQRPDWEPRFKRSRPGTVSLGLLLLGYTVVFAERFLIAFWPFLAVLCGSLALGASGWLATLSPWPHIAILAALAGILTWSLLKGFQAFQKPNRTDVLRHLERSNKLAHRPAGSAGRYDCIR